MEITCPEILKIREELGFPEVAVADVADVTVEAEVSVVDKKPNVADVGSFSCHMTVAQKLLD